MKPHLRSYLRLVSINQRFEEVLRRNPRYKSQDDIKRNCGRVAHARMMGVTASYCYENDCRLFDMYVHHNQRI